MSENVIHIQRADGDSTGQEQGQMNIQDVQIADETQQLTQADQDAVNLLINDPEFQRAVQQQVAATASGETVYVQVATASNDQGTPTSIVVNKEPTQQILPAGTLRHELTRQMPTGNQQQRQIVIKKRQAPGIINRSVQAKQQLRPHSSAGDFSNIPISARCLLCNSATRTTLRTVKGNPIILGLFSDMMTQAFPKSDEKFKVCDTCIGVLDKMKDMRDIMMANFKQADSNFELQATPLTRKKFGDEYGLKRARTDDDSDDRAGEHEYHRSETTYQRSKKAIEISGLLTKQYLNIAPFTDEERLSIAGVINVAAPTELAAKIMKCPALLNAIKKLILLETNHTCEKLCSAMQMPGPSVLRLKGVNTISEDDLISEIIVEMRRCMPFVMDLLFTICRPLHAPRVECREIMAIMYAMGMYCRSPALTAVRRINVGKILANRIARPRVPETRGGGAMRN